MGFSKRTFAEWGSQVSTSFKEAEVGSNKLHTAFNKLWGVTKTAFGVPKEELDWRKTSSGEIVSKDNIDSYIPNLSTDEARSELLYLSSIQTEINNTKGSWDDYNDKFQDGKKYLQDYARTNNVLKASVDDVKRATENARQAALSHNAALQQQTLSAKAATLGLKALSIAGNMLLSMGISMVISAFVGLIDDWRHASERAKEAANELSSELASQKETIEGNISTVKGLEDEFKRLSKGVDDYGANISLSADEYARYQEIVQQIVGISPSLISSYDKEGNAIANKNGLIEQSIALLEKENRQRIENATSEETIKTLGKGKIEEYKDVYDSVYEKGVIRNLNQKFAGVVTDAISDNRLSEADATDMMSEIGGDVLKTFENTGGTVIYRVGQALAAHAEEIIPHFGQYKSIFETYLSDKDFLAIDDMLNTYFDKYSLYLSKLETASKALNPTLQLVPQSLTVYDELSDKQKDFVSEYINTFRITADTTEADIEKMRQDILDFTQAIGDASPETKKAIEDLFSLDRSKIPADEFEKQVNELINQIVNSLEFDSEDDKNGFVKALKIKLGFEFMTDGETTTKKMQDDIKNKLQDEFDDKVNDMSVEELKVAAKIVADIPEGTIISWDELQEKISATADAAEKATASLSDFEKVSDNIGKVASAAKQLNSDGYITIKTINELKEATGLSGDEWAEYETKLLNAKKDSAEFNQVMSELTYKMIENQLSAVDLTNATDEEVKAIENKIAATLRENGVTNASAVAHDYVVRASEQAAAAKATEATAAYANAIANGEDAESAYANAQALLTECGSVNAASSAMEHLNIIQNIFNNTNLDASQKIAELQKYGFQASLTAAQLSALADTTLTYSDGKWWVNYYEEDKDNNGEKDYLYSEEYKGFEYKMPEVTLPDFSGAVTGKSGADKAAETADKIKDLNEKIADTQEQLEDLAKSEALDAIKYKFDQIEQSIEKISTTISLLDNTLDLTPETDYVGRIGITSRQMELAQQKASMLKNEFNQLKATEYTSADAAEELAGRMKSVADELASNTKEILEYNRQITEYYMSALNSISGVPKETLDEAMNFIDRNIKALSEGSLTGLTFSLSPIVPESAYEKQREENESIEKEMQEHYETVAAMQTTALDMQYQEQVADNQRKRAELINTLEEARAEITKLSSDVQQIQKQTNTATSAEQQIDDANKEAETQRFSTAEMSIITNLNNWMVNNPIVAPGLDTTSWEAMVTKAEEYATRISAAVSRAQSAAPSSSGSSDGSSSSDGSGDGNSKIVSESGKYLGVKYVYGAESVEDGMDCSGYVYCVLRDAGYDIGRYAADDYRAYGTHVDKNDLQPGDLVFYGKNNYASHIGIYLGNGMVRQSSGNGAENTSKNPGKGVCDVNLNYRQDFIEGVRLPLHAKGTKNYGVAGENYRREYLIDKKTGEWTAVDSPTLIDTNEIDVVGEEASKKIDHPIKEYASGTINVPSGLGGISTYEHWSAIDDKSSLQYKLREESGEHYDGIYAVIGNRKVLAMTDTFGNVGDYVDIQMSDGSIIRGVIGDIKDQTRAHGEPANKWGHYDGQNIIEFIVHENYNGDNPKLPGTVVSVTPAGNYFRNDDPNESTYPMSDWQPGESAVQTKPKIDPYLENLFKYIEENQKADSENTQEFYKKMAELNTNNSQKAKEISEGITALRETAKDNPSNYAADREALTTNALEWIQGVMTDSIKITLDETQRLHAVAKERLQLAYDYFDKKVKEGATATELETLREGIAELNETANQLSDDFVEQIGEYTSWLISNRNLEKQHYKDVISSLDKKIEKKEYDVETNDFLFNRVQNNLQIKKSAQNYVASLLASEEYLDLTKGEDVDGWFTEELEQSAYFKELLQTLSASDNPEDSVRLLNFWKLVQAEKLDYNEASEQIEQDMQEMALNNVEKYIELQERKAEILEYVYQKEQLIIDAESNRNDLIQSIRDSEREYAATLRSNKDLAQWMDDDTREALFNEADYSKIMNTLQEAKQEIYANEIWYKNEIAQLDENEMYRQEELTAELARRNERSQERIELAKQELEVAKKTSEYNNIAKERDTQVIMGNRKVNIANPESLYNASKELADAKIALEDSTTKYFENEALRTKQAENDKTKGEADALSALTDAIGEFPEQMKVAFAEALKPFEVYVAEIANLAKGDPNWAIRTANYVGDVARDTITENKGDGYDIGTNYTRNKDYIRQAYLNGQIDRKTYIDMLSDTDEKHGIKDASWYGSRNKEDTFIPEHIFDTDTILKNPDTVADKIIKGAESWGNPFTPYLIKKIEDYASVVNMDELINRNNYTPNIPVGSDGLWKDVAIEAEYHKQLISSPPHTEYTVNGDIVVQQASNINEITDAIADAVAEKTATTKNMRG